MDLENVVYSTHVYPNKGSDWAGAFGDLSRSVPVFAGEFGGSETADDLDFVQRLMDYLEELEIGWTAWSWSDSPFVVTRYAPTAFGKVVLENLAKG
jgi:hypothetical protein